MVKEYLRQLKNAHPDKTEILDVIWVPGEKIKMREVLIFLDAEVYSGRGGGKNKKH